MHVSMGGPVFQYFDFQGTMRISKSSSCVSDKRHHPYQARAEDYVNTLDLHTRQPGRYELYIGFTCQGCKGTSKGEKNQKLEWNEALRGEVPTTTYLGYRYLRVVSSVFAESSEMTST